MSLRLVFWCLLAAFPCVLVFPTVAVSALLFPLLLLMFFFYCRTQEMIVTVYSTSLHSLFLFHQFAFCFFLVQKILAFLFRIVREFCDPPTSFVSLLHAFIPPSDTSLTSLIFLILFLSFPLSLPFQSCVCQSQLLLFLCFLPSLVLLSCSCFTGVVVVEHSRKIIMV